MREYSKKPENQSRTLDSNPRASKQAPIEIILQRYKNLQSCASEKDEEPLQGKFEKMPNNLIQFYRNEVIQMVDRSVLPANYAGAAGTTLGIAAANMRAHGEPHSNVLRASLVNDSGVVDPMTVGIDNQAHHIVEANDPAAADSRLLLQGANIDIDSPINGVLLPTSETDDTGNATIHRGGHREAYAFCIHRSLTHAINSAPGLLPPMNSTYAKDNARNLAAGGLLWGPRSLWLRGVLINRLGQIRTVLLSNMVPINNSVDAEFIANSQGAISIYSIFKNAGIIY